MVDERVTELMNKINTFRRKGELTPAEKRELERIFKELIDRSIKMKREPWAGFSKQELIEDIVQESIEGFKRQFSKEQRGQEELIRHKKAEESFHKIMDKAHRDVIQRRDAKNREAAKRRKPIK